MQSVHHALDVLKDKLGLAALAFDGEGQAAIRVSERMTIHLTRVDDGTMEASFRLPELDHADGPMMAAMLSANFLGATTGAGRLAIDPEKGETVFCQRFDVLDLSADGLDQRFGAFAEAGAYWLTVGSRLIDDVSAAALDAALPKKAKARPAAVDEGMMIRL